MLAFFLPHIIRRKEEEYEVFSFENGSMLFRSLATIKQYNEPMQAQCFSQIHSKAQAWKQCDLEKRMIEFRARTQTHIRQSQNETIGFVGGFFVQHHYLIVQNVCPSFLQSEERPREKSMLNLCYLSVHNFSSGYFNMV